MPLTTIHASKDCNTRFPDVTCATAVIGRLIHHVETLSITGKSHSRHEQVRFPTLLCRHALNVRYLVIPFSLPFLCAWIYEQRLGTYRALHSMRDFLERGRRSDA
jgi:hypothetical protein